MAIVTLFSAAMAMAQSNRPDLSEVAELRDIEYVPGGHWRQKLDLYVPKAVPAGSRTPRSMSWSPTSSTSTCGKATVVRRLRRSFRLALAVAGAGHRPTFVRTLRSAVPSQICCNGG